MNENWNLQLKSFLVLNKITVKEAATKTGIKQSTFNSYMRGIRTPNEENQRKISDVLGFDITHAIYGDTYDC